MLQLLWNVVLGLVALAGAGVGLFVVVVMVVNFTRMVKWELAPHEAKELYLRAAVRAAFKQLGMSIGRYADEIAMHPRLPRLVKAANDWMRVHGWPSQFTDKNFAVVFAHLKVEMETPGYRMSAAIGNLFAPPAPEPTQQSETATGHPNTVNA